MPPRVTEDMGTAAFPCESDSKAEREKVDDVAAKAKKAKTVQPLYHFSPLMTPLKTTAMELPQIIASRPTLSKALWCRIKAVLCFVALLLTAPICFVATFVGWLAGKALRPTKTDVTIEEAFRRKVLVTGLPHTKGLHVIRGLAKAGHTVVVADHDKFWCSAVRWSRYVSKFYTVPRIKGEDDYEDYVNGMLAVAQKENVDWFIPVSHTMTSFADTIIKQRLMKTHPNVKSLVFDDPGLTKVLDDKVLFLDECQRLQLAVPDFKEISDVNEVYKFAEAGLFDTTRYFLKPLMPYSEDRENFSRIPSDVSDLKKFLATYDGKITRTNPYCVNQFIRGPEFAANAIVKDGEIQSFHVCPSSPMQIDYDVVEHHAIREWVEVFCRAKAVTGSICFDFLEDKETGKVYCIECNPRLHSAVTSYHTDPILERAIRGALESEHRLDQPLEPSMDSKHVYWLYNEIAKVGLGQQNLMDFFRIVFTGVDAVWDLEDPIPFFMLNHLQMPALLWEPITSEKRWNIMNFCLGQLR